MRFVLAAVLVLLALYVAQPYLGRGLEELLGLAGLPSGVSLSVSVILALLLATIIQMVLGELGPKTAVDKLLALVGR